MALPGHGLASDLSHGVRRRVRQGARDGRRRLADVNEQDCRITTAIGHLPYSAADPALAALTRSANHSKLWFAVATVLAAGTRHTRRGALRGVLAIAGASLLANGVLKPLVPRRRPAAELLPAHRSLDYPPTSSSFPSGHAASAAAFATAVAMESPKAATWVLPLAATVAYSRVHVGVHWTTDVAAGAGLGALAAMATKRWLPIRDIDEAAARPVAGAPRLPEGDGLALLVNTRSGRQGVDPYDELRSALPQARVVRLEDGADLVETLTDLAREDGTRAIGIAGGDGSVAAAARVAEDLDMPLAVVPAGTLNHFGRDVGVYDTQEAIDATGAGEAVAVDLGELRVHPDVEGREPARRVVFVNTSAFGGYPEMVRLREKWQKQWGKWPSAVAALLVTLARSRPTRVRLNGVERSVWMLFVGNGPYVPTGMVPSYRPRLDTGVLEVRYLRADRRLARTRAFLALATGVLGHNRIYQESAMRSLDIELLDGPVEVAADGEVVARGRRLRYAVADHPVPVYRRDETLWPHRATAR
ncbi:undecaprenyl-diphosphatase [Actinomycetospora cinnamomea]|uniref:Undecaprenyl-diphosphatase n=1 Tax=Actinomycetospora cinnamomea TaxID=663609 RepID=A0A2U1EUW4_9PSEU|nr:undecaprenyl-diphosphatase [Actinomycetospora cinnamomea]